jgi:hypothetical protein
MHILPTINLKNTETILIMINENIIIHSDTLSSKRKQLNSILSKKLGGREEGITITLKNVLKAVKYCLE